MSILLIAIIGVALLILLWERQQKYYVTQYLFFVRYPLITYLVLVLLPVLGPVIAPDSLTNLFVLNFWQIGATVFVGALVGLSTVYTFRLIWVSVPGRCNLELVKVPGKMASERAVSGHERIRPARSQVVDDAGRIMGTTALLVGLAGAAPLAIVLWLARAERGEHLASAGMIVLAFAAAAGLRMLSSLFANVLAGDVRPLSNARSRVYELARNEQAWLRFLMTPLRSYTKLNRRVLKAHRRAVAFALVALLVYVVIGILTGPWLPAVQRVFPALVYILALLLIFTWIASALSFQFDATRLPGLALLIVFLVIINELQSTDHVFITQRWPTNDEPPPIATALSARLDRAERDVLIAVGASGGGISAAVWATTVLRGLEAAIPPADAEPGFRDRVALLSGVSGGAVGVMHYVDGFSAPGAPPLPQSFADSAARSSLSAAAWGLVYPDLLRLALGAKLGRLDRGWSQERSWAGLLNEPDATLGDWQEGCTAGWRPMPIFNITIQESGKRLALAPARFTEQSATLDERYGMKAPQLREDISTYLPDRDVAVVTAARLSATFPYVSPQSAPAGGAGACGYKLHSSDGGYFDNSGLVSALDAIDQLMASGHELRKVILIEIRTAPSLQELAETTGREAPRSGLLSAATGPLETLYNVRSSSQQERNLIEIDLARQNWASKHQIESEHVVLHLSGDIPLSWHLTDAERTRIEDHWPEPIQGESRIGNDLPMRLDVDPLLSRARESNAVALQTLLDAIGVERE